MDIEVGDWVKVRCNDGICRLYEVSEVGKYYIGDCMGGTIQRKYVLDIRKRDNGNEKEKDNSKE